MKRVRLNVVLLAVLLRLLECVRQHTKPKSISNSDPRWLVRRKLRPIWRQLLLRPCLHFVQ